MHDHKCPFSAPLVAEDFACENAEPVVRRGGAEIACRSASAQQDCVRLFELIKQAALPSLGLDDDLLSMPHSVLVKIQYGGLLGLQAQVGPDAERVANIHALVNTCIAQSGLVERVPVQVCVDRISDFRLRRRRGR